MITVAKDNSGDFDSIQKAVDSVSDNNNETIFIKKGIYKERIEIRKNNITLIGEDTDETIITEGFYARMIMPDGSKRGISLQAILHSKTAPDLVIMSVRQLLYTLKVTTSHLSTVKFSVIRTLYLPVRCLLKKNSRVVLQVQQ